MIRIAFEVAFSPTLGPPVHLIAFLWTCKHICHAFSHTRFNSNDLSAKNFGGILDAPARHPLPPLRLRCFTRCEMIPSTSLPPSLSTGRLPLLKVSIRLKPRPTLSRSTHTPVHILYRHHIRTGSLRSAQGRGGSRRRCLDALPGRPQRRDDDGKRLTTCWDPWVHVELKGTMYTFGSMDGLWQGRMFVRYAFLLLLSGLSPRQ